jgi:hypothetical protein
MYSLNVTKNMKHILKLSVIGMVLCFCESLFPVQSATIYQSVKRIRQGDTTHVDPPKTNRGWTPFNMDDLEVKELRFIGKTFQDLYFAMKIKGMNIGDVGLWGTSPWAPDSDGHIYIDTVILYETDTYELSNGQEIRTLEVTLEEKVDLQKFVKDYRDNMVSGLRPYHIAHYQFECRIKDW